MGDSVVARIQKMTASLSSGELKIAQYLVSHWHDVAFSNIEGLAEKVGVSPSSIVRFAQKLGYSGYPDLQAEVIERVRAGVEPRQRMNLGIDPGDDLTSVLIKTMRRDMESLEQMVATDPELLTEAMKMILAARTVQVMGTRSSYAVATYLGLLLGRVMPGSGIISLQEERYLDALADLQPQDLVVCITFPRYARVVVEVARFAKEEVGAKVLGITGGVDSPLAKYSDLLITCPFESGSFQNSYVAALSFANALVAGVAWAKKDVVEQRLIRSDRVHAGMGSLVQTRRRD